MTATLGTTAAGNLALDLERLIGGHMGIVANAGGGKSGLIRRLLEQTHGHIQHIVLDVEDEFYTLRQGYDYVIAGGQGGDAPATPANAGSLATAALAHGFSLICQLNDLGADGAGEFVANFLGALMRAPQDLWRPLLVVIDETQRFDPTSIRMLTERGRKRGFTAVLASQRLPKIDPSIRGDVNNWLMGRVGQALDRRIMADQLGFSAKEGRELLGGVSEREFYAMGPALSREPVLFRVGDVETAMVKPGQAKVATPPAPEAMREILAGLAVQPEAEPVPSDLVGSHAADSEPSAMIQERDEEIAALEAETTRLRQIAVDNFDKGRIEGIAAGLRRAHAAIAGLVNNLAVTPESTGEEPVTTDTTKRLRMPRTAKRPADTSEQAEGRQVGTPPRDLNAAANKMLAMLERIAPARVTWASLAAMIGNKATGGNFNAARKGLRESGLVVEEGDSVRSARPPAEGMTRAQAFALWHDVLANPAPRMMQALLNAPSGLSKVEIGEALGIAPRGGNFNHGVAQMLRNGVAVDRAGVLVLADPLPGERA